MSCIRGLARGIIILSNLIFLLLGLLFLGVGIALKVGINKIFELFVGNTQGQDISEIIIEVSKVTDSVAIGFVISGVIIFIVGLLGVVGACCLSKPILVLYLIFMIVIVISEIVIIILLLASPASFHMFKITDFRTQDSSYQKKLSRGIYIATPPNDPVGFFWYLIQNMFACCGWKDNADFSKAERTVTTENDVPPFEMTKPSSCCKQKSNIQKVKTPLPMWNNTVIFEDFDKCKTAESGFYNTQGCSRIFKSKFNNVPQIVIGIVVAVQVVVILCSMATLHYREDSI